MTQHRVSDDFVLPSTFRAEALPGLLLCQIIVGDGQRRVLAWWKSSETYKQAWGKEFTQLLGAGALLCFEGFQLAQGAKRYRVGWAKPTAVVAVVSALVALVTGLSTLQDWVYSLVAEPDCTLWTDPVGAAKPKAIGDDFAIQIQVKNRHLRASSTAHITPRLVGDGLKVTDEKNWFPIRIDPGKAEVEEFRFTALRGGRHVIRFEGKQQAGVLRNASAIRTLEIQVDVWDVIDQTPRVSLVKATDHNASISVDVRNAQTTPYGTALEAILANPGEIEVWPDKRSIKDAEAPLRNADFAQLRWRIPPCAETLKLQNCRLLLQEIGTTTRTETEWLELLKHLAIHADEPDDQPPVEQTK